MPSNKSARPVCPMLVACCAAVALQGCGSGMGAGFFNSAASSTTAKQAVAATQLGYAWNATDRTLRPIVGIAGASRLAASVVPAQTYAAGASSTASATAVLVRTDGSVDRVSLPDGAATNIGGISVAPNARVRFSPSGAFAVVFAPGNTGGTLLRQVNATPQASVFRASSALVDAAVSDLGTVAVLQTQGTGSQLAIVTSSNVQALASLNGSGALTFLPKRDDVLAADAAANALMMVRSISTAPASSQVATASLLKTPLALGASSDGRWLAVANSAEASVVRIDLSGATAPQKIACPVQPTMVDALAGNASFRFTDVGRSPGWIADVSAQQPTMLFVPALAGS